MKINLIISHQKINLNVFLEFELTLLLLKINRKSKLLNVTFFKVNCITHASSISFELYNKIFYYLKSNFIFSIYIYNNTFYFKTNQNEFLSYNLLRFFKKIAASKLTFKRSSLKYNYFLNFVCFYS
jgi:hypothetical protein